MMRSFSFFLFCFAFAMAAGAQETVKPLKVSAEQALQYELERTYPPRTQERGGGSLSIPFFDDFSTYSMPTDNPDIPVELQRWEDDFARINSTLAISPPTIGVATFDG
ncbi:MAG: hypothetical protein ACPGWM_07775, partial [Flavobacteriales bacterium]